MYSNRNNVAEKAPGLDEQVCVFSVIKNDGIPHQKERCEPVFIYGCDKMKRISEIATRFSKNKANVLIIGESGVGKDVIAELIHSRSDRSHKPFIKLNCAAIPDQLFESELFGHKKGSFTGAHADKTGKFQLAHGGTLFLDEIAEIPLQNQAKLLRAIEDFEITPIGALHSEKVDIRIICATNKNLDEMVKKNEFRLDLKYRLDILSIPIPPLRERKEDIAPLVKHFLYNFAKKEGNGLKDIEQSALEMIEEQQFPGNVRELRSLVYKIYLMTEKKVIQREDIETQLSHCCFHSPENINIDNSMTLNQVEVEYIRYQLKRNNYSVLNTSRILGIEACNLSRKLSKLGISARRLANYQNDSQ